MTQVCNYGPANDAKDKQSRHSSIEESCLFILEELSQCHRRDFRSAFFLLLFNAEKFLD